MNDALWQALDYLAQGGWIMLPLGAASIAMWTLILERMHRYRVLGRKDIRVDEALQAMAGKPLKKRRGDREGLRARLLAGFLEARSGDPTADASLLHGCRLRLESELGRHLALIAVLAGVAPLLGLLGTVLGMIETFQVISRFGTGNAKAMAGGISVALVTTQTGLLVAIPGLFLSGMLMRRARQLRTRLDEISTVLARQIRNANRSALAARGA